MREWARAAIHEGEPMRSPSLDTLLWHHCFVRPMGSGGADWVFPGPVFPPRGRSGSAAGGTAWRLHVWEPNSGRGWRFVFVLPGKGNSGSGRTEIT